MKIRLFRLILPLKPLNYFRKLYLAETLVSVAKIKHARHPIRKTGLGRFIKADRPDTLATFNFGKFVDQDLFKFFASDLLHFRQSRLWIETNKLTIPTVCVQGITEAT